MPSIDFILFFTHSIGIFMTDDELAKKTARDEAYKDVKMYMASDWELKEETPNYFLLEKNTAKMGVHILLFLFTMGLGNIVYYFVSKKKKKILK